MCKILIIPAIKESKRAETNDFLNEMAELMSKANKDGLGYAAIDKDGELFSERWLTNSDYLSRPSDNTTMSKGKMLETSNNIISMFGSMLKDTGKLIDNIYSGVSPNEYTKSGSGFLETDAVAVTLHTRMATCAKTMENVHPFIEKDTSVIHNGIINNHSEFNLTLSTCDSESILKAYLKTGANKSLSATSAMADSLYGYYACGVFSRDANGNRILDVFKANNNMLSVAYIFELETYVLASSGTDIKTACSTLGFTHGTIQDMVDGIATRINPFTGDVIEQSSFKFNDRQWVDPTRAIVQHQYNNYNTYTPPYVRHGTQNHGHSGRHINKPKGFSKQQMDMMSLTPSIVQLGTREVREFTNNLMKWA